MNAPPRRRFERPIRFVRDRFSPQSHLGLHLTIGILIVVFSAWCFSEIAEQLGPSSGVVAVDESVINWFHERAEPPLTTAARAISLLGSVAFLIFASVACAAAFAWRRAWDWLLALSITMLGGSLLNILLKHFFQRQRPVLENPLVTLTSFGFPSGHTMGATVFYGLLALIAAQALIGRRSRFLALCLAVVLVAAIGTTRIYLGAHFLSDVLAALAAGILWLTFSWTTVEAFRMRRKRAGARNEDAASLDRPAV